MPSLEQQLKAISKKLQEQIGDVLKNEVAEKIKDIEQETIQEEVYDVYNIVDGNWQEPFMYERRYDKKGGLQSRDSMKAELSPDNTTLTITNIAKGQDDSNLYIAPLVEYGDKVYGEYDYKKNRTNTAYQYLQPRPFTQRTVEKLRKSKEHVKILKQGLKSRGINVVE